MFLYRSVAFPELEQLAIFSLSWEVSGVVKLSGPLASGCAGEALGASLSLARGYGTYIIVPAEAAQSIAE